MDNQTSNECIGKRISELRKRQNLAQNKLADMIGTTPKHLSEIERGITGISIDVQVQLSEKLYCSIDYLVKGQEFQSIDSVLPPYIVEIVRSGKMDEIKLLTEYLNLYETLRKK